MQNLICRFLFKITEAKMMIEKPIYWWRAKTSDNKIKDNTGTKIFPRANREEIMDVSVFFKAT